MFIVKCHFDLKEKYTKYQRYKYRIVHYITVSSRDKKWSLSGHKRVHRTTIQYSVRIVQDGSFLILSIKVHDRYNNLILRRKLYSQLFICYKNQHKDNK